MSTSTSLPPSGRFHTVTPSLTIAGAQKAMDFYKSTFGAEILTVMLTPGKENHIMHGEIKIGDIIIFIMDPMGPANQPPPSNNQSSFYLYVNDVDSTYKQAIASGATSKMAPVDCFWGDRTGVVVDPYGQTWSIATKLKDMTPGQIKQAQQEFFKTQTPKFNTE